MPGHSLETPTMNVPPYAPLFSRTATNPVVHAGAGAAASAFVDVLSRPAASDVPTGVPVLAHAVLLDDAQASGMVVVVLVASRL